MASPSKRGTGQFVRQGHTEAVYGTNIDAKAKGNAGQPPKEVKA